MINDLSNASETVNISNSLNNPKKYHLCNLMKLVDSHIHLYSEEFEKDQEMLVKSALDAGVKQFFLPAVDSESHEAMLSLEKKYPGQCFAMMGLHPVYVKENYKEELKLVEEWLKKRKFVAVGEIGLDLYWDETFKEQQLEAFHIQIGWALKYNYPIVIHCRDKKGSWVAMETAIEIVEGYKEKGLKGIFHCFSGLAKHANKIVDAGFYLGIGGVLTYKNSGLTEAISEISLDRIVLETDGPYLAPVPFRGKTNNPAYLRIIAEKLAEVKGVSLEEVANITSENTLKIFGC